MAQDTAIEKRETQTMQTEHVRSGQTFVPNVDILEQDNELLLLADMPGVQPSDVDIHCERGMLMIRGKAAPRQDVETTEYLLREYGVGDFRRRFEVGEGIDASAIEAELQGGVLTVHLPKAERLLPRKIAVKTP